MYKIVILEGKKVVKSWVAKICLNTSDYELIQKYVDKGFIVKVNKL